MESFLRTATATSSDSSSLMKQAEQIWSMLDDMAENNVDSYKKFIEKTLKDGKEAIKQSNPEARFCLKTSLSLPSKKVLYVNILSWARIPAPQTSDKPIPIFGRPIEENNEHSCFVVSVALNPTVIDDSELKSIVLELVFDYIEQQNKIKIDRKNCTILKEKNYFGDPGQIKIFPIAQKKEQTETSVFADTADLPENLIKRLTNIGVNEKSSQNQKNKAIIEEITPELTKNSTLKCPIYEEKIHDSAYCLKIHLPLVESFSECELNIDSEKKKIILDVPTKNVYKKLEISYEQLQDTHIVEIDQIQAKFVRKERFLRVKIPLKTK